MRVSTVVPTTKTTGGSVSANSLLRQRLETLDIIYRDVNSDKVSNGEYFTKVREQLEGALNNSQITATEKGNIQNDLFQLQKDEANWSNMNQKNFGKDTETLKDEIKDNWKSIWGSEDFLQSGSIFSMADMMLNGDENSISYVKDLFEEYLKNFQEFSDDKDIITRLEKNIKILGEEESHYNRIMSSPDDFGVVMESWGDGSIDTFEIMRINDIPSGYVELGDVGYGQIENEDGTTSKGTKMFGKPTTDDDGNLVFNIGGQKWSGISGSKKLQFVGEKKDLDLSLFRPAPFEGRGEGSVLRVNENNYLVQQKDGSYLNYKDKNELLNDGISLDRATDITNDNFKEIQGMYNVESKQQVDRQKDINNEMSKIIDQYQDKTSTWYQWENMSAEEKAESIGESVGYLGKSGINLSLAMLRSAELAGKGLGSVVSGIKEGFSNLKEARDVDVAARQKVITESRRPKEPQKIFKSFFGGIKSMFSDTSKGTKK